MDMDHDGKISRKEFKMASKWIVAEMGGVAEDMPEEFAIRSSGTEGHNDPQAPLY